MLTQRNHDRLRARWPLPGLALAMLLMAGPAAAQSTSEKREHADTMTNPCSGEQVVYEGFLHIMEKTTANNNGSIHFTAKYHFNGQGIGQVTQLQHNVGGTANVNGKFPPGPVTTRQRTRVVSQGPTDNFYATFIFHANGNGEPTTTKIQSDCNGSSKGGQ